MKTEEVIPMPHILGRNLAKLRRERNLRQRNLSEKLGIKLCTYASYEEGRAEPPLMILFKIKSLYKLQTVEELFY